MIISLSPIHGAGKVDSQLTLNDGCSDYTKYFQFGTSLTNAFKSARISSKKHEKSDARIRTGVVIPLKVESRTAPTGRYNTLGDDSFTCKANRPPPPSEPKLTIEII